MNVSPLGVSAATLAGAIPAQRCSVSSGQLLIACRLAWEQGGQLAALWSSDERDRRRGFCVHVLLRDRDGLTLLEHTLPDDEASYPDLSTIFPLANRMQRAAFDLIGTRSDSEDPRPWTWQAAWPIDQFPLRRDFVASPKWQPGEEDYPFVRVEGDGVHEIAVGPVHAGIIEPGHFRFQVVGEKVLRLEERLGFTHKGIEKRFETLSIADASRLAARISGDSAVTYGWAYAQAAEAICGLEVSRRAMWLRALCLERERVANHLGDLGYLGNDGGFAFGLAQFSRLKEDVLRLNRRVFGHRLLMDVIIPGGVTRDLSADDAVEMRGQCVRLKQEIRLLRDIYDDHAGLQDRFRNCGRVDAALAAKLGLCGFAGRASGVGDDLRCDFSLTPYDELGVRRAVQGEGDVAARVAIRFDEALESLRLIDVMLDALPSGEIVAALPPWRGFRQGIGCAEGWRGPVWVALESGPGDAIRRCHPHDPSWQNWPALEYAVIGNIVPDFPLINKSFNLSYSGHDL
ncbi:MAG: NADH-quinone oxidoreductase subunit C [Pseudomonadota bacterium]|nr:NADH-quinone oxidoreductase subunit C [Pseudomonadota bacterium]